MARLLQQWDRYHARASSTEPGRFDLNEAVGAVAREASVSVGPAVSAGPLWIQGSPSGLQQLLWLLIEESLQACALAECSANLALETQPADNGAIVRLTATGDFQPLQEEPDRVSLVGATCRSFAARLDVRISQEQCDQTRRVMVLELSNEEK